jgi:hypothetical protein
MPMRGDTWQQRNTRRMNKKWNASDRSRHKKIGIAPGM